MKPKDDLFRLIKSLSKNEKGYFKKYAAGASGSKDKNYVRLFDAIEKQEKYDEDAIRKKFSKEKFTRQLHVAKNYLFQLILHALEDYHSGIDSDLQSQLNHVQVLFEKGLYDLCETQLFRAKEKALRHERYAQLVQCNQWEKNLLCCGARPSATIDDFSTIAEEGIHALEMLADSFRYRTLRDKLFFLGMKSGVVRDRQQQEKFDRIAADPLLANEELAITPAGKFMFNNALDVYTFYAGGPAKMENGMRFKKRMLELLESNPAVIPEKIKTYFAVLMDLLSWHSEGNNPAEFRFYLGKLRSLEKNYGPISADLQAKIFYGTWVNETNFYTHTGAFETIRGKIAEIEKGMERYDAVYFDVRKYFLYYNIAYLFFGISDFKSALRWLNKILNAEKEGVRSDLACFSRIFALLVHFELENTDLLPYLVASTERFLSKQKRLFKCEEIMLGFFKESLKPAVEHDLLFRQTLHALHAAMNDPFEKKAAYYFDFISWLKAKTENKSFAQANAEQTQL